jgi:putative Mg2+ transporter-C (MgtC) family protein
MDFGELIDVALWSRVGMALLCGGIVGLERQLRGKPAGMRTSSLVCLGTTMFVYLGSEMRDLDGGDATRVLGQIVSGIGFLGAGVIMTRNGLVTGVTSAAVIWVLAASGAAIGIGRFGAATAISVATVAILVGVEQLERVFAGLRRGVHQNILFERALNEQARAEGVTGEHQAHDPSELEPPPFRSSGVPPYRNRE